MQPCQPSRKNLCSHALPRALPPSSLNSLPKAALAALAAVTLAWAGGAQAQSLQQLYDAARTYDAAYLGARAQAQSAEFRAAQSDALNRPVVSANANATVQEEKVPVVGTGGRNTVGGSVGARYPLFNLGNNVTIAQAAKSVELARADLRTAEQDLIIRLSQAYFDVLAAQDALGTTQASKTAITEQLASAKRNFEVGTATITDTREAQARFDLSRAQEIAAENDLLTKRIALDQLVGRTAVAPKGLAVPVALPATAPAEVQPWVDAADLNHPAVRRAQLALDIARLEIDKARAGDKPTLDAVASVGTSHLSGSSRALTPGTSSNALVGVQLAWPLYTGGAVSNRVKETVALEERSRNDLDAARRGVAQVTRQAFFGVQSLQAQVKALEAAESSSKLALEATQLGYKVGVRVNLDVLNAQTQLFTTQRDLAKARYDVLIGSLRLRQGSGQLSPEDLAALNAVLAK